MKSVGDINHSAWRGSQNSIYAVELYGDVGIILVRYAEMGLKSRQVRERFERMLVDNIMSMFVQEKIEAILEREEGRILVRTDDVDKAVDALRRVFGVASVSPVILHCSSDMEEIASAVAALSEGLLGQRSTFAVRARREGTHTYTSMELAREVGSAVLEANRERMVSVDLTAPDITFFIEVRGPHAYIFTEKFEGPGGLPLGSQGKVIAVVEEEKDLLAAWLMLKRGCRTMVMTDVPDMVNPLRRWAPGLRVEPSGSLQEMIFRWGALGVVYGYTIDEMEKIKEARHTVPSYFPLVGMSGEEIKRRMEIIRR